MKNEVLFADDVCADTSSGLALLFARTSGRNLLEFGEIVSLAWSGSQSIPDGSIISQGE